MSIAAVLAPVFILIALTIGLLLWTGRSRVGALKRREVKLKEVALGQPAWPDKVTQVGNAYQNQLETPVLFYVLVALAIITKKDDLAFVGLEWLYVLTRLAHAYIHTGTNNVPMRFNAFILGVGVLALMWAVFAVRILFGV